VALSVEAAIGNNRVRELRTFARTKQAEQSFLHLRENFSVACQPPNFITKGLRRKRGGCILHQARILLVWPHAFHDGLVAIADANKTW